MILYKILVKDVCYYFPSVCSISAPNINFVVMEFCPTIFIILQIRFESYEQPRFNFT